MRYSETLIFYGITIDSDSVRDCIDAYHTLAASHYQLLRRSTEPEHRAMHRLRMIAYVEKFKDLIRDHGTFSGHEDPSGQGLHLPQSWTGPAFPHESIFASMPEITYNPGDVLPGDLIYLDQLQVCNYHSSPIKRRIA